jgi:hypothetical protein
MNLFDGRSQARIQFLKLAIGSGKILGSDEQPSCFLLQKLTLMVIFLKNPIKNCP